MGKWIYGEITELNLYRNKCKWCVFAKFVAVVIAAYFTVPLIYNFSTVQR